MKKPRPLTAKQRLFIDWYLRTWNATESARRCRHSWHTLGHTRKYRVAANTPQHGDMVEHGVSPQADFCQKSLIAQTPCVTMSPCTDEPAELPLPEPEAVENDVFK